MYSVIHTACHMTFTLTSFSDPQNCTKLNDALIKKHFDYCPTYLDLVGSIPGVTGVILMAVITIMFVCSLDCVRRKYFQLFSTVHIFLFPIFLIASFVHGADGWINFGFPTSCIFLPVSMLIYTIMILRRFTYDKFTRVFRVADASFSNGGNFMFLNLIKPKSYTFKPGQYAFINIPEISRWQWHPFSIASSPNNDFMVFMIQNSGDYTKKLLNYMYDIKKKSFDKSSLGAVGPRYQQALQEYMISMKICDISLDLVENNKRIFPKIYVSRPISAPAEYAALRKNLILVGAGSGIAPFLAFLDDQQILVRGG